MTCGERCWKANLELVEALVHMAGGQIRSWVSLRRIPERLEWEWDGETHETSRPTLGRSERPKVWNAAQARELGVFGPDSDWWVTKMSNFSPLVPGGCQIAMWQPWWLPARMEQVLGGFRFFHQLFRFSGVSKVDDHVAALETRILVCLGPQNSKHRQRYGRYSVCHWQPFKLSNTISLVAPASGCREHAFTPGLPKMTRGSTLGVGLTPVRRGGDHSPGAHCAGPRWLTELTLP